MRTVKFGGAALNQTPLAWDSNLEHILEAIELAKKDKVSILCLPELCICGYGCEDTFYAEGTRKRSIESLLKIVPHTEGIAVAVGLPIFHEGSLYNSSCLVVDRQILGFSCKQFLANEGLHYEARWFRPWIAGKTAETEIAGRKYPIGDICYALGDVVLGFEICEDAWVLDRPGRRLATSNVDVIFNPSASHFAFDKISQRKKLVQDGAKEFNCAYVYTNHVGNESGRAIYDGGTIICNDGEIVEIGPRFSFKDCLLSSAFVDLDIGRRKRRNEFKKLVHLVKSSDWKPPQIEELQSKPSLLPRWEVTDKPKEEEFTRSVSLALFDYLRKSYSRGFVLSLSGGADSAAVACLVHYSLKIALGELGREGFLKKLSYFLKAEDFADLPSLTNKLLTTVYQASENSGEITRSAAAAVAAAVGAKHHEVSVAQIISSYTNIVQSALGRELSWKADDIPLQNIQARARGPLVWMFANIENALLLATSNRSEVAVGYATMDGDTCGSISPIAGIDKAFIRSWLKWLEKMGPTDLGAIPQLKAINDQEPTAELRPGASQRDEDDLMPYEALEMIERAAIRDRKEPSDILILVKKRFPEVEELECLRWVKLFFTLWSRSQWKRERYAPSFHLDDESLDPKTWCRFPILSGGYKKELSELF